MRSTFDPSQLSKNVILAGHGADIGYDFYRFMAPTECWIDTEQTRGGIVVWVRGDAKHARGFMRRDWVRCIVRPSALASPI